MARRSKTKLKGGPDQAPMQRALEQGEGAVHRASESLRNQINTDMDANLRIAEKVGQGISSAQATVERREKEAKEDLRYRQAQDFKKQQAATKTRLAEERMGLEARKAGYEYTPGRTQEEAEANRRTLEAQQPETQKRLQEQAKQQKQELGAATTPEQQGQAVESAIQQQEMERARVRREQQMTRPIDPSFTMTPEARSAQRAKTRQRESQLDIQRMNALSRMQTAKTNYMKARQAGNKEAMKFEFERLQQPAKKLNRAVEDLLGGKQINGESMNYIMQNLNDHPAGRHIRPGVKFDELDEQQQGEVLNMLRNQTALAAIKMKEGIGKFPDPEHWDESHPIMQKYFQNAGMVNNFVKSTGWGRYSGAKSQDDKNSMVGRIAAEYTLRGMMIAAGEAIASGFGGTLTSGPAPEGGTDDRTQPTAGPQPGPNQAGPGAGPTGDTGPQFSGREPDLRGPRG